MLVEGASPPPRPIPRPRPVRRRRTSRVRRARRCGVRRKQQKNEELNPELLASYSSAVQGGVRRTPTLGRASRRGRPLAPTNEGRRPKMRFHRHDLTGSWHRRAPSVLAGAVTVGVRAGGAGAGGSVHLAWRSRRQRRHEAELQPQWIAHHPLHDPADRVHEHQRLSDGDDLHTVDRGARQPVLDQVPPPGAPSNVITKVAGTISGTRASGTLNGSGVCGTGPQSFHASPARSRPPPPPPPKPEPAPPPAARPATAR